MSKEFKIKYNYSKSEVYEDKNNWLIGCKIIEAETYLEAQDIFKKEYPSYHISDIEKLL